MIRILLADGQQLTRRCLRLCLELEPDLRVVGEAGDGATVVALAGECRPDVVIMDSALPVIDGIAAAAALRRALPATAIIIHGFHDDTATRNRARDAGASAFVSKHTLEGPLLAAIRAAVARHGGAGAGGE